MQSVVIGFFVFNLLLLIWLPSAVYCSSDNHQELCTYNRVQCEGSRYPFSVLVHSENSYSNWRYVVSNDPKQEELIYTKIAKACRDLGLSSALDVFIDDDMINGMMKSSSVSGRLPPGQQHHNNNNNNNNNEGGDQGYNQQTCTVLDDNSKTDLNGRVISYYIRRSSRMDLFKYLSIYEKKTENLSFSRWSFDERDPPLTISSGSRENQRRSSDQFHQCEIQVYQDSYSDDGFKWRISTYTNLEKWFKLSVRSKDYDSSMKFSNLFSMDADSRGDIISLIKYSKERIVKTLFHMMKSFGIVNNTEMDDLSYFFNPRILNDTCRFLIFFQEMKSFADGTRLVLEPSEEVPTEQIIGQFSYRL